MSWRDDLRRVVLPDGRRMVGGSFRGVPFFVDESDRTGGGRRGVVHEFPGRDDPFVRDLGRRGRVYRLECHVIGDSYLEQKDALLSAIEDVSGPGELVHPYYSSILRAIVITPPSVRETSSDGGMATISVEFTETPRQELSPTRRADLPAAAASSADAAQAASRARFLVTYDPAGLPSHALDSVETALSSASAALEEKLGPVARDAQELALLSARVRAITNEAASLVRQPDAMTDQFLEAVQSLQASLENVPAALAAALVETYLVDLGPDAPATTPTRVRERSNQVAAQGLLRQLVAAEAGRAVARGTYDSVEAATAARNAVLEILDEQVALAEEEAYSALAQLRADVTRAQPAPDLAARVMTIERRVPVPSLVLAYQLYGSVDLESDIVARNLLPHPAVAAGSLRVLSRA